MERKPVSSSNVAAIGYDVETEILEVEFLSGSVYEYRNVPQVVYEQLMNTSSIGSFISKELKNHYPFEKIG